MEKETMIPIKAISANHAYAGRVYPTKELTAFKRDMAYLLPKGIKIPKGKLSLRLVFGVCRKNEDVSNKIKYVEDALALAYHFNDKMIYRLDVEKRDVTHKGNEFITFAITSYHE
jgi:hypothetical protein